jgi:carbon monoxide dehydrogenase subunit G
MAKHIIRQQRHWDGRRGGHEPMIRTESSVTIDRPVAEVYAFVSDCRNEPRWHTDAIEATGETAVGAVQTWVLRFMGRREGKMKVSRLEPERLEELQALGSLMGMQPTISYLFEPVGSQTRFTRRMEMQTRGVAKIMPVRWMTTKRNQRFVSNLKGVLEKA